MKRKKKNQKTRHITIRVSDEMLSALEKKALREDTSVSRLGREGLALILAK